MHDAIHIWWHGAAVGPYPVADRCHCAFADFAVWQVDAGHLRLGAEVDQVRTGNVARLAAVVVLGELHDRAALGGLIGQRRQMRRLGQGVLVGVADRDELGGHAVAERDGAGLVQNSVVTSPAASTARPDMASTLWRTMRSMPAMPIAEINAPMVVGDNSTSRATNNTIGCLTPEKIATNWKVLTATRKMNVRLTSTTVRASSFCVRWRLAPSTNPIMRSRKVCPGGEVIDTTMRSDSTTVPPVTADRSPPDSRTTGADSPVMADSSTIAIPSTTSPSPGIACPASMTHRSPTFSSVEGVSTTVPSGCRMWATVSCRARRNASACALPRPSAIASAKLPNSTVNHKNSTTRPVNRLSVPLDLGASRTNSSVVQMLPT